MSKANTVAELVVWAGTVSAWNVARSGRSWIAVKAFQDQLIHSLVECANSNGGEATVEEKMTLIRDEDMSSRIVLASSSVEALLPVLHEITVGTLMPDYWNASFSTVLLVDDTNVSFRLAAVHQDASRAEALCKQVEGDSDGQLLIKNTTDDFVPYFRYEATADAVSVVRLGDAAFRTSAPNKNLRLIGKSVVIDEPVVLAVELANGPGKQAQFESHLTMHGIEETMVVAATCENPHRYWRTSQIKMAVQRHLVVNSVREIIRTFRREVGTINRAFVSGVEV